MATHEVSIIILNLDAPEMTIDCVRSVHRHSPRDIEVIVVDNGSQAANVEKLRLGLNNTVLVTSEENCFYGEGNHLGVDAASGEILVFLNNDVVVIDGWLEPLIQELRSSEVGAVGPVFLNKDGSVQESGAHLTDRGRSARSQTSLSNLQLEPYPTEYVSGACLAIRRESFERVCGFDPIFLPAYFEDADLCLRLRAEGLHTKVVPTSRVVHEESSTSRRVFSTWELRSIKWLHREITNLRRHMSSPDPFLRDDEVCRRAELVERPRPNLIILETPWNLDFSRRSRLVLYAAEVLRGWGFRVSISCPTQRSSFFLARAQIAAGLDIDSEVRWAGRDVEGAVARVTLDRQFFKSFSKAKSGLKLPWRAERLQKRRYSLILAGSSRDPRKPVRSKVEGFPVGGFILLVTPPRLRGLFCGLNSSARLIKKIPVENATKLVLVFTRLPRGNLERLSTASLLMVSRKLRWPSSLRGYSPQGEEIVDHSGVCIGRISTETPDAGGVDELDSQLLQHAIGIEKKNENNVPVQTGLVSLDRQAQFGEDDFSKTFVDALHTAVTTNMQA